MPDVDSGVAVLLSSGEPERLYTGLSVLVSTATDGRAATALASFGALGLLLDPDLRRRVQEPEATPSLSWSGREAFAASLVELREIAVELAGVRLQACSASVETMGLTADRVTDAGLDGVLSTPRFLREASGAALLVV